MNLKDVWEVFKQSSMQDKDMQRMFRRYATPNACIELLEENEKLKEELARVYAKLEETSC